MVRIRLATAVDLPALNALIEASARILSRGFYSPEQTEAAIREVFGADSQLIADGTYFACEEGDALAGCGGWSRRRTLYGGDQTKTGEEPFLDPSREAARIRAFFVHPDFARRGIGSLILDACVDAARAAGFRRLELASTLPGIPFYRVYGFEDREPMEIPMENGLTLPVLRMERSIDEP
jgi:GNAT superfamily N-acetyltransferase